MRWIYLRRARESRGWTQEQLEAESGVPQPVISRLENDPDTDPAFSTVRKLVDALNVDPMRLRFGPAPEAKQVSA